MLVSKYQNLRERLTNSSASRAYLYNPTLSLIRRRSARRCIEGGSIHGRE